MKIFSIFISTIFLLGCFKNKNEVIKTRDSINMSGYIIYDSKKGIATHEIGHLLGLDHKSGGLMSSSGFRSTNTSQRERGEIINGGEGQISPTTGNGTYKQSSGNNNYKTSIKSQVNNFTNNNNISW